MASKDFITILLAVSITGLIDSIAISLFSSAVILNPAFFILSLIITGIVAWFISRKI